MNDSCVLQGGYIEDASGDRWWSADLLSRVKRERDEARAEVERLRRERDEQIAEAASWRATARDKGYSAREVAADRDKAQAAVIDAALIHAKLIQERDKLLSERRQLRARLVECRPWVGVCPWPDTPGWRDVIAVRDLVDDTLEEVK